MNKAIKAIYDKWVHLNFNEKAPALEDVIKRVKTKINFWIEDTLDKDVLVDYIIESAFDVIEYVGTHPKEFKNDDLYKNILNKYKDIMGEGSVESKAMCVYLAWVNQATRDAIYELMK